MPRLGDIGRQYFDDNGDPLGGGKLYFYETGTSTQKLTYADISETIPNSHPVVLDAAGRQPDIFFTGYAKAILTDADDVQIEVRDPIGLTSDVSAIVAESCRPYVKTVSDTEYTIQDTDENYLILFTATSAITVTIPNDTDEPDFPTLPGVFICHLHQKGSYQITVVAGSGVTLRSSVSLITATTGSAFSIARVGVSEWNLVGDQEQPA